MADRRAAVIAAYDTEAPGYDEHGYPSETQREWAVRLLQRLPPDSIVLDAPCGTGKYFPIVVAAGHRVVFVDQSAGILDHALARGLAASLERLSLQDISYRHEFDAVLTIDAMENVPPEDWSLVLSNLHRAVRPGGYLYMSVEQADESAVDEAFDALSRKGMPSVRGEVTEGDVAA